jgi:hypothetical protein
MSSELKAIRAAYYEAGRVQPSEYPPLPSWESLPKTQRTWGPVPRASWNGLASAYPQKLRQLSELPRSYCARRWDYCHGG